MRFVRYNPLGGVLDEPFYFGSNRVEIVPAGKRVINRTQRPSGRANRVDLLDKVFDVLLLMQDALHKVRFDLPSMSVLKEFLSETHHRRNA